MQSSWPTARYMDCSASRLHDSTSVSCPDCISRDAAIQAAILLVASMQKQTSRRSCAENDLRARFRSQLPPLCQPRPTDCPGIVASRFEDHVSFVSSTTTCGSNSKASQYRDCVCYLCSEVHTANAGYFQCSSLARRRPRPPSHSAVPDIIPPRCAANPKTSINPSNCLIRLVGWVFHFYLG